MEDQEQRQPCPAVLGASVVIAILVVIGLLASFGAGWMQEFLKGPAANWAQALGGIAAVLAAIQVGENQVATARALERDRRERERREKLQIAYALFANGIALCNTFEKQWSDASWLPPDAFSVENWSNLSTTFTRIDLMQCPSPQVVVYLVMAPRMLDELRNLHRAFLRSTSGSAIVFVEDAQLPRKTMKEASADLREGLETTRRWFASAQASVDKAVQQG